MPKVTRSIVNKAKEVVHTAKSAIQKKKKNEFKFDYSKYGVKKENSFIGTSYSDTNTIKDYGKKIELDGVFIAKKSIKITGASTIYVSKGCLTANEITLEAQKSITVQGSSKQVFQTSIEASNFIKLKAPRVTLNGVRIVGSADNVYPGLVIESNVTKIFNSTLHVGHTEFKDDGKEEGSVFSVTKNRTGDNSEFWVKTLSVRAANVYLGRTDFTCQEIGAAGSLEFKRTSLIDFEGVEDFPSLKKLADQIDNYITSDCIKLIN